MEMCYLENKQAMQPEAAGNVSLCDHILGLYKKIYIFVVEMDAVQHGRAESTLV